MGERERERETDRQTDRQTGREVDALTTRPVRWLETDRDIHTERQRWWEGWREEEEKGREGY